MMPVVTIGIPTFQNAATIERAILSVQAQSFKDWRLIVTDDCSTDDTFKIVEGLAGDDDRIEVRRNRKRLGYMNFKVSLTAATTGWFVWLAGDDYWGPRFLEACLDAAGANPKAVSVLPRWSFAGLSEAAPRTLPLDGTRTENVGRFLAAPGGTRMYGLTRREVMASAFPKRPFNAFDWYLMLGILRAGAQIEVPEILLYREKTPLRAYVEIAARDYPGPISQLPILRMSLAAMVTGRVPLRNFGDLVHLNLRKHEEHLAYLKPAKLAGRIGLFRTLGLSISTRPEMARRVAVELARNTKDRREGAGDLLAKLAEGGDGASAIALGQLRKEGLLSGDAAAAFKQANRLGSKRAAFHLAALRHEAGEMSDQTFHAIAKDTLGDRGTARRLAEATRGTEKRGVAT